jgi:hypothetical protein
MGMGMMTRAATMMMMMMMMRQLELAPLGQAPRKPPRMRMRMAAFITMQ